MCHPDDKPDELIVKNSLELPALLAGSGSILRYCLPNIISLNYLNLPFITTNTTATTTPTTPWSSSRSKNLYACMIHEFPPLTFRMPVSTKNDWELEITMLFEINFTDQTYRIRDGK